MNKFQVVTATVLPLQRANVDTDQIIPKQFLRSIRKSGFGQFLFDEWRYRDRGELGMDCRARPTVADFPLNMPRYAGAKFLLTQDNFGCGSSREHAVWALLEYGFCAIIAPSFGDIFANNAAKNGLLTLVLPAEAVADLFAKIAKLADGSVSLRIDLPAQTVGVVGESGESAEWKFNIGADTKKRLLEGADDIALTLRHKSAIAAYEAKRKELEPWLFADKTV